MSFATMTSKGQTTIPKEIRDRLGLQPKDQIQFTLLPDGTVIMRAKRRSITDFYGALHREGKPAISIDDMQAWRK